MRLKFSLGDDVKRNNGDKKRESKNSLKETRERRPAFIGDANLDAFMTY